ncbi:hypothetical protein ON010_g741 [Phytophthora cinnamomi]|nr:hypothetical protein ON010_g741 [Phytophthora cinnamomi]
MTITVFCAVIGVGSVFYVDIGLSKTVDHLKDKIKEKEEYGFPANNLKLYLAREGDTRLNSRHDAFQALKKGNTPD